MFSKLKFKKSFFSAGQNANTVKGYQYRAFVSEGFMDYIHGGGSYITEIYIPSHKIIFNSKHYVFSAEGPRNERHHDYPAHKKTVSPLKKITISKALFDKLAQITLINSEIEKEKKTLKEVFHLATSDDKTISEPTKILKYKRTAYEDMMDLIHGGGHYIEEFFIPSHEVIYNSEDGIFSAQKPLNISTDTFSNEETVEPLIESIIPKELADKILRLAKLQEENNEAKKNLESDNECAFLLTVKRGNPEDSACTMSRCLIS